MSSALHNLEAHRAGRAFDDLRRRVEVVRVEVLHLDVRDLAQLRALDRALASLVRLGRTRLDLRRLLEKEGRRRRLGGEGEAAVRIDGDDRRDRGALLELLRGGVERLAEFHDVDAALAKRRADRRRRIGDARWHLQRDIAGDFLCHVSLCISSANRFAAGFKFSGTSERERSPTTVSNWIGRRGTYTKGAEM